MSIKCILTGQTPSVLDGVTENVQNQLNNKQDKIVAAGILVGNTDGTITGVEDTFVSYDEFASTESVTLPSDWHIGDNGNWYLNDIDMEKPSRGEKGEDAIQYISGQNIAITDNVIGTKAFPCNPNLLDNWYFGNPVNQRGQTSYSTHAYSIDRWKCLSGHSLTIQSTGIKITCNSSATANYALQQFLENLIVGIKYTLSALIVENTTTSGINLRHAASPSSAILGTGLYSYTFTATSDTASTAGGVGLQFNNRASDNGNYMVVLAVKLELGTEQTLAHQDADGNWVLNEIPDYGEQLRRCQRYCWVIPQQPSSSNNPVITAIVRAATSARTIAALPTTMRVPPTVTTSGAWKFYVPGGSVYTVSSIYRQSGNAESLQLEIVTATQSLTSGLVGFVAMDNDINSRIIFSADL